ncbi:hypothetical protein V5799_024047 [Amblyomma americanum]|uniref:MICOS complex subunit MIC60 n=1 Tax=Amblyomma americanum TaxID=6943 RepID=A0AAQ4EDI1_AMBAM
MLPASGNRRGRPKKCGGRHGRFHGDVLGCFLATGTRPGLSSVCSRQVPPEGVLPRPLSSQQAQARKQHTLWRLPSWQYPGSSSRSRLQNVNEQRQVRRSNALHYALRTRCPGSSPTAVRKLYWKLLKQSRPLPAEVVKEKALESSLLRKRHPVEPARGDQRPALPPPPPIAVPPPTPVKEKTPSPQDLEAEAQKQLQDIKERNERLNFALEQSLREAQAELEKYTKDAVVAELEAKEAAQSYARKLYRAIDEARDSEDQYMWDEALQAKEAKLAAVQKAAVKSEQAWKCLENLQSAIKKGQEDKETHSNLALSPAQHAAKVALEQLRNAESQSRSAKEAARTATDYKDAVERAQLHFQKEIEALLPETKFTGQKLSEDELNLLLAHAHRKIENLTKAHAKIQSQAPETWRPVSTSSRWR